jgi:hypothetical protein
MASNDAMAATIRDTYAARRLRASYALCALIAAGASWSFLVVHCAWAPPMIDAFLALVSRDMALVYFAVLNVRAATNVGTKARLLLHAANGAAVVHLAVVAWYDGGVLAFVAVAIVVLVSGLAVIVIPPPPIRFWVQDARPDW